MTATRDSRGAWLVGLGLSLLLGSCATEAGVDRPDSGLPDGGDPDGGDPSPTDRGVFSGSLASADELRDAFDETDPIEPVIANFAASPGSERLEAELDDLQPDRVVPLDIFLTDGASTGRVPWNTLPGVGLSAGFVETDYNSNWPLPDRELCVQPVERISCCTYTLTEGEDGSGITVTYYSPEDMYATDASAAIALQELYAQVPLYLPYTNSNVKLSHGWIYNGADRRAHGSFDYSKSTDEGGDPSFRVRSIASGRVVAKYWDNWHGNVLVIEHDDIGDFQYRSFYFHLRNGKTNDLNMAKTRTVATGDPENSRDKYLEFANLDDPSDLWWGTDSQAIPVDVGDFVWAQRQVAWSGNTGPGGAGAGLDEEGMPTNSITANNHLHFMVAVKHPLYTGDEWLYVDFYGVYEQQSSGCYDLVVGTRYDRLAAPFYPYFHNVDLGVFNFYLYYYGQMGRSPTTLSIQQPGDGAIAAGAFKSGLSPGWFVFDYLKADDFQDRFDMLVANDFRLVDRSVTLDTQDVPRFNGLFRPDTIDDWFSFGIQTPEQYQDQFDMLTDDGYDLTDFFGYHEGNTDRIASIFVPQPGGFIHEGFLSSQAFKDTSNDYADDGWLPVDVNVMEMAEGTFLSGLYRQTGDARMVHWGMSSAEYQQWMDFYLSQGWDLEVVQNYADGDRYAAIWSF
jgi:hypothetical protein